MKQLLFSAFIVVYSQCSFAQDDSSAVAIPYWEVEIDPEIIEYSEFLENSETQEGFEERMVLEQRIEELPFESSEREQLEKVYMQIEMQWMKSSQIRSVELMMSVIDDDQERETGSDQEPTPIFEPERIVVDPAETVSISELEESEQRLFGQTQFDSRIETRALNPTIDWQHEIMKTTKSVGMIVENSQLSRISDSLYQLDVTSTLGEKFQLCPGEAFEEQPVVGIGSAFIVEENSMMTAAHVFSRNIQDYSVVFGFEIINRKGVYNVFIPEQNVYAVQDTVRLDIELDLIQFSTDRPINREVLKIADNNESDVRDRIYMVGFPMGLPQKVAVNASVRSNDSPFHYFTTLDAFTGNSGSPVFDLNSHKVIGVLVSGGSDYEWNGSCNQSVVCNFPNCMGERVAKINRFFDL